MKKDKIKTKTTNFSMSDTLQPGHDVWYVSCFIGQEGLPDYEYCFKCNTDGEIPASVTVYVSGIDFPLIGAENEYDERLQILRSLAVIELGSSPNELDLNAEPALPGTIGYFAQEAILRIWNREYLIGGIFIESV